MDKLSYALGIGIGRQMAALGKSDLQLDDFSQAIKDVFSGKQLAVSDDEARTIVNKFLNEAEEKKSAAQKKAGEEFLAANKQRPEIHTTASGLQYEIIKEGNGKKPKATDRVKCHYEGQLIDGTLFDSSVRRGQPATFGVSQVIAGWVEALQMMSEGAKWKLYIPSELGYGAQGAGELIPPHSVLIFEVELLEVM
ncbi:MAG: FKBP-type peptidyl-prolyl cis-trans isomerase [Bacteroidaceae bacterium]|jgi:FKBP-type peptidyl-prolyl cis-trans isomerase FklB